MRATSLGFTGGWVRGWARSGRMLSRKSSTLRRHVPGATSRVTSATRLFESVMKMRSSVVKSGRITPSARARLISSAIRRWIWRRISSSRGAPSKRVVIRLR